MKDIYIRMYFEPEIVEIVMQRVVDVYAEVD